MNKYRVITNPHSDMKILCSLVICLSILLNCSTDKHSQVNTIEQLLSQGSVIQAYH